MYHIKTSHFRCVLLKTWMFLGTRVLRLWECMFYKFIIFKRRRSFNINRCEWIMHWIDTSWLYNGPFPCAYISSVDIICSDHSMFMQIRENYCVPGLCILNRWIWKNASDDVRTVNTVIVLFTNKMISIVAGIVTK